MGGICGCCKLKPEKHLELLNKIFDTYDKRKIQDTVKDAYQAAHGDSNIVPMKDIEIVEYHVKLNINDLIAFAKQTTDKIEQIGLFLYQKTINTHSQPEIQALAMLLFSQFINTKFHIDNSEYYLALHQCESLFLECLRKLIKSRSDGSCKSLFEHSIDTSLRFYSTIKETEIDSGKYIEFLKYILGRLNQPEGLNEVLFASFINFLEIIEAPALASLENDIIEVVCIILNAMEDPKNPLLSRIELFSRESDRSLEVIPLVVKKMEKLHKHNVILDKISEFFSRKNWENETLAVKIFMIIFKETGKFSESSKYVMENIALNNILNGIKKKEKSHSLILKLLNILYNLVRVIPNYLNEISIFNYHKYTEVLIELILYNSSEEELQLKNDILNIFEIFNTQIYNISIIKEYMCEHLLLHCNQEAIFQIPEAVNFIIEIIDQIIVNRSAEIGVEWKCLSLAPGSKNWKNLMEISRSWSHSLQVLKLMINIFKLNGLFVDFHGEIAISAPKLSVDFVKDMLCMELTLLKHGLLNWTPENENNIQTLHYLISLFKILLFNSSPVNFLYVAIPFLKSLQLEFLEEVVKTEEYINNFKAFSVVFKILIEIISKYLKLSKLEMEFHSDFDHSIGENWNIDQLMERIKKETNTFDSYSGKNEHNLIFPLENIIKYCAMYVTDQLMQPDSLEFEITKLSSNLQEATVIESDLHSQFSKEEEKLHSVELRPSSSNLSLSVIELGNVSDIFQKFPGQISVRDEISVVGSEKEGNELLNASLKLDDIFSPTHNIYI